MRDTRHWDMSGKARPTLRTAREEEEKRGLGGGVQEPLSPPAPLPNHTHSTALQGLGVP